VGFQPFAPAAAEPVGGLDVISAAYPAAGPVLMNMQKITGQQNASGAQDSAAFGQTAAGGNTVALASGGTGQAAASAGALLAALGAAALAGAGFTGGVSVIEAAAAGLLLVLQNTTATPAAAMLQMIAQAGGDRALDIRVAGDTFPRLQCDSSGALKWGSGSGVADAILSRSAPGMVAVSTGSLDVSTAGQGLRVKAGLNCKMGTGVLVAGSAVVANTSVTANSEIFVQDTGTGGAASLGSLAVSAIVPGTSFTVTSSLITDTSTFNYLIMEPG
jgi:hypothetical protein